MFVILFEYRHQSVLKPFLTIFINSKKEFPLQTWVLIRLVFKWNLRLSFKYRFFTFSLNTETICIILYFSLCWYCTETCLYLKFSRNETALWHLKYMHLYGGWFKPFGLFAWRNGLNQSPKFWLVFWQLSQCLLFCDIIIKHCLHV